MIIQYVLYRQETEEEGQSGVPTASRVDHAIRAEDILCGMHFMHWCFGEEADDYDYETLDQRSWISYRSLHTD
jgi:hypothetical protein